jgi:acyl-CoA synthetase (AMP-forming)/AMP-acid ligase II
VPKVRRPAPLLDRIRLALRRGLTVANLTDRLGSTYGDRAAFSLPARSVIAGSTVPSYADVARGVARLTTALRRAGVRVGDTVAVAPSNGADFLLAFLAAARAGAVVVPINPILKPAEVRTLVELSGAKTIILDAATMRSAVGGKKSLPTVERWLSLGPVRGATDVLSSSVRTVDPAAPEASDTVVAVMYTSGTTGTPKGARLTSDGLLSLLSIAAVAPTGLPGTLRVAVTALPVAHIMGLAAGVGLLLAGVENHMFPRFDAAAVLDEIERVRADMFVGVPAMYRAMLDAGASERDLRSVKAWMSAADKMPAGLAKQFQSMGRLAGPVKALFVEAYGMVELAGAALLRVQPPGRLGERAVAAVPIPPYKVKVVDRRGKDLPRGRTGELCVKGPGVLEGYQGDDAATKSAVLEGGWLRTGDLARIGPLGAVSLSGRKKEAIKVGGYSVFPVEVEEEIRRHPKVADVAVVGIPDGARGTVPAAAVVPARGSRLTPRALDEWAREEIASYRRPRRWLVLKELPRGSTRKADKRAITRLFEKAG